MSHSSFRGKSFKRHYAFVLLLFIGASQFVWGQTIQKVFTGCSHRGNCIFEFLQTGEFKIEYYSGHAPSGKWSGKYKIRNDTIKLNYDLENTSDSLFEYYILDEDSTLIDTKTGIGNELFRGYIPNKTTHCDLQYPHIGAGNTTQVSDLETVLNLALNTKEIKALYHFDKIPSRRLFLTNYYKLKANIEVDGVKAIFKDKSKIRKKFHIEFEEIRRIYKYIGVRVKIHGEGTRIHFYYEKANDGWNQRSVSVFEN